MKDSANYHVPADLYLFVYEANVDADDKGFWFHDELYRKLTDEEWERVKWGLPVLSEVELDEDD